jgi:peptide/nickel transport system substrate-binding protein
MVSGGNGTDLQKGVEQGAFSVFRCGPASGSNFLFFNQNTGQNEKTGKPYLDPVKQSWFRNEAFRKAAAFALDRKSMIDSVFGKEGYPQWSPMSPSDGYFFTSDVTRYEYDTAKARAILAGAGYRDINHDGLIEDSGGHPVEFSFITNNGNGTREKIARMILKNLEQLGCKVRFQMLEFNDLIGKIDKPPYSWEAALLGLSGAAEPNCFSPIWSSFGERHMWFPRQKTPSTPWEAAIDSIFNEGRREIDESRRVELYGRWQKIAADKLPFIYTVLPERIIFISRKFKNINPSVNGGVLHNLESIFIPPAS